MRWESKLVWAFGVALGLGGGCGESGTGDSAERTDDGGGYGSHGVTQGGAQDIGRFRQILASGEVPSPETLDPVGFFNEHALDLPPADCGQDVCLHAMLAVAPRFDGSNWTMAYVAMNTPVDPATLPRPPMRVTVAIEKTTRTAGAWADVMGGVRTLQAALEPSDTLSLVVFAEGARLYARDLAQDDVAGLDDALAQASAAPTGQRAALYDAMATASQIALEGEGASRLLVVTSGYADAGVADEEHVLTLAEGIVREGTSLTIVGAGEPFDPRLPYELSDLGAGAYYHPEDGAAFEQVFGVEAATTLFPIAQDFRLQVTPAPGYKVGRVYGVKRFASQGGLALLDSPALFVGHRTGADDTGEGRRGGGGALFVELIPEPDAIVTIGPNNAAFRIDATWTDPLTRETRGTNAAVVNPMRPGETPDASNPYFSESSRSKAYWMLNCYLALRAAVDFQQSGDCARAKGVIDMVQAMVEIWLLDSPDTDIQADLDLMLDLRYVLEESCTSVTPIRPQVFDGGCYAS